MSMNDPHDIITARLSDYLDGDLDPSARAEVDAHLRDCVACSSVLHELRAIVEGARHLPVAPPAAELWPEVAARIAPPVVPFHQPSARRVAFTIPQLAAAAIALMVLTGGLVYMALPHPGGSAPADVAATAPEELTVSPVSLADPHYDSAVGDLERTLAEGRARLDPETVRVLEQNLATIDQAIAQSRKALEADPANVFLNSHLVSARQRKLALLRRATALTTGS